ncbi:MAG: Crp/Fnr family transcriptional regulator [Ktedonobacterales bacterium]
MFRRRDRNNSHGSDQPAGGQAAAIEARAALLSRVPLFVDLGKRDIQTLAAVSVERHANIGEFLVQQGQAGAGLFVIASGSVVLTQQAESGDARLLATLGPGDVFGEMALLDDLPRSASALASEPTDVLLIPVYDFRTVLHDDADIAIRLLAVLSRRLRRIEAHQM